MSRASIPKRVSSYDRDAPTPAINSRWIWELGKPIAEETITVTNVEWNGEEWWVETVADPRPRRGFVIGNLYPPARQRPYWNDLSRFWEAVSTVPARP